MVYYFRPPDGSINIIDFIKFYMYFTRKEV